MDFSSSLPPSHMDVFCQTPLSWKVLATIACLRLDILRRTGAPSNDTWLWNCQEAVADHCSEFPFPVETTCWNSYAMELGHRPASSISSSCVHAWVVIGLGNGIHDLVGSGQKTRQYVWSSPLILYPTYMKYHEIHTSHRSSSLFSIQYPLNTKNKATEKNMWVVSARA